jgi:hypothetical protein
MGQGAPFPIQSHGFKAQAPFGASDFPGVEAGNWDAQGFQHTHYDCGLAYAWFPS